VKRSPGLLRRLFWSGYNVSVKFSIFSCPRCRTALQIPVSAQREKILRCSKCGFIFPGPHSPATPTNGAARLTEDATSAPTTWVDWQSSNAMEPAPAPADPPPRPRPRRFRPNRRRRSAFPWVFLVVGLVVGLASIGLLVVLVVAFWPSGKSGKLSASNQKVDTEKISLQNWQEYVSQEGRFRVSFPGPPTFKDDVVHTRIGSLPVKCYDCESGDYEFSVFFGELGSDDLWDISPEKWIDAEGEIYIVRANAKLRADKSLSLHGHFGKERRYELSVGWFVVRRMYAVNRCIYTVNFARKKREAPEEIINRFFDSFEILDEPKSKEQ